MGSMGQKNQEQEDVEVEAEPAQAAIAKKQDCTKKQDCMKTTGQDSSACEVDVKPLHHVAT
eukprot:695597-Amphidinium_carterae.1